MIPCIITGADISIYVYIIHYVSFATLVFSSYILNHITFWNGSILDHCLGISGVGIIV